MLIVIFLAVGRADADEIESRVWQPFESEMDWRVHQEKRFCAPKSRQKSQHFTTSLDSVWLHLNSVWVSLSS